MKQENGQKTKPSGTIGQVLEEIGSACASGRVYGLKRIKNLMKRLGDPQDCLRVVHIAGTNGKGSVSRMMECVLCAAGYRVGTFSSPAVSSPSEYLRINGKNASDREFADTAKRVLDATTGLPKVYKPTVFEFYTAMAFCYFERKDCDIVIIECGLGGTKDSTNVVRDPLAAVITRIGEDHLKELGGNLYTLSLNKCGIIKDGCDVVAYPCDVIPTRAIKWSCKWNNSSLVMVDPNALTVKKYAPLEPLTMSYDGIGPFRLSLCGRWQALNAAVCIETIRVLRKKGFNVTDEAIKEGLENAALPGRFEIVSRDPLVIVDGSHNPQGVEELVNELDGVIAEKKKKFIGVVGVMADKDYKSIFDMLGQRLSYVIGTCPDNPRALGASDVTREFAERSVEGEEVSKPSAAVAKALKIMRKSEEYAGVIVTGSLYMVAETRKRFLRGAESNDPVTARK